MLNKKQRIKAELSSLAIILDQLEKELLYMDAVQTQIRFNTIMKFLEDKNVLEEMLKKCK